MVICQLCGKQFNDSRALAIHRTRAHKDAAKWGPNRKALEETIAGLRGAELLGTREAALVQALRSLADQIDRLLRRPEGPGAQLWKAYREMLAELTFEENGDGDSFEKLLAEINGRAAMGYTEEA